MPYKPIDVDLNNHTIMGIDFNSVDNFESVANALGTMKLKNISILIIGAAVQLFGQNAKKDTTFLFKDTTYGMPPQMIFIDNNKNSKHYNEIAGKPKFTKTKSEIPWTDWVMAGQYKGEFYAYKHCCGCSEFRQFINNTTFINSMHEGDESYEIIEQKKIDNKTFEFNMLDEKIIIHIIDMEKGIAVFEKIYETYTSYYLMIAANKIKSVPIIVNYCPWGKQSEFKFDEPDFEALLKGK